MLMRSGRFLANDTLDGLLDCTSTTDITDAFLALVGTDEREEECGGNR